MSIEIRKGVCGAEQESSFMNATLQPTPGYEFDFSIAVHVAVPDEACASEDSLAAYLTDLLSQLAEQPNVQIEIEIGPYGDGEDV